MNEFSTGPNGRRRGTIGVLIVDDHAIVRRGLNTLISGEADMRVVGEAADGYEVLERVRELSPDIILLDLVLPGQSGLEVIAQLKADNPATRVLVLTSFGDNDRVFAAVRAGANGYLLKDASPEQLLQAIHDVYNGESHLHPTIALKMLRELDNPALATGSRPLDHDRLQPLGRAIDGRANHIGSILRKLHLANRTQAALYALRRGLVDINNAAPVSESEEREESAEPEG